MSGSTGREGREGREVISLPDHSRDLPTHHVIYQGLKTDTVKTRRLLEPTFFQVQQNRFLYFGVVIGNLGLVVLGWVHVLYEGDKAFDHQKNKLKWKMSAWQVFKPALSSYTCVFTLTVSGPKRKPLKKQEGEANVASKKEKSSMSCTLST